MEYIQSIKLRLNNEWRDVSEGLITSSEITLTKRSDEVFGVGHLKMVLDIDYSIPPYSLLLINDSEYYLCKSTSNKYLTRENTYFHDFEILEPTAILACYLIGSKSFSITGRHRTDAQKLLIIGELILVKYGVHLILDSSIHSIFTQEREYQFGSGTTLYDALIEIAKYYNAKPIVNNLSEDTIYLQFKIFDEDNATFEIDNSRILKVEVNQNTDEYCNYLESEMQNVVDRTNTTWVRGLTTRIPYEEGAKMDTSNARLILPSRIEKIKTFIGYGPSTIKGINISMPTDTYQVFLEGLDIENGKGGASLLGIENSYPYYEGTFSNITKAVNGNIQNGRDYTIPINDMLNKFMAKYNIDSHDISSAKFRFNQAANTGLETIEEFNTTTKIDLTSRILEMSVYEILPAADRVRYCFYTSGSDTVDGMYEFYKDDFWNNLLGISKNPFLAGSTQENISDDSYNVKITFDISSKQANPILWVFDIEYYPIADFFMKSDKSILPLNEASYKAISRSYNNSSNFVDFDRANYSIQKNNDILGQPSILIEYNSRGLSSPEINDTVYFNGQLWYISMFSRTVCLSSDRALINLVRDYNKVAEAIGVETQFSATKNPTNHQVDRYVYAEQTMPEEFQLPNNLYLKLTFDMYDGSSMILYKNAVLYYDSHTAYLTCKALSNYCLDRKVDKSKNESSLASIKDISYVDENNELYKVKIDVVSLNDMTAEDYKNLPELESTAKETLIISGNSFKVYKDARERLIFTLKLNNVII